MRLSVIFHLVCVSGKNRYCKRSSINMNKGVHGGEQVVVRNILIGFFIDDFTTRDIDGVGIMAGQTGATDDCHRRHRVLAVRAILAQILFVNITEKFIAGRIERYGIFNIERCSVVNERAVPTNRLSLNVNGPVGDQHRSRNSIEVVVGGSQSAFLTRNHILVTHTTDFSTLVGQLSDFRKSP